MRYCFESEINWKGQNGHLSDSGDLHMSNYTYHISPQYSRHKNNAVFSKRKGNNVHGLSLCNIVDQSPKLCFKRHTKYISLSLVLLGKGQRSLGPRPLLQIGTN